MNQKVIASFVCKPEDFTSNKKHINQETDFKNLEQAFHNVLLGQRIITLVEKAYGEIETVLSQVKHYVSSGLLSNLEDSQKPMLEVKISQSLKELDEIVQTSTHKGQNLLTGTLSASVKNSSHFFLLVGSLSSPDNRINLNTSLDIPSVSSKALGLGELSVSSKQDGLNGLMMLKNSLAIIIRLKRRSSSLRSHLAEVNQYLSISIENHHAANTAPYSCEQAEELIRVATDFRNINDDY
jgi:flagellin-like hook-associated protein FlgL